MEAAERVAVGAPLGGLLDHHVLLLGLAFQVITAVAGAILLTSFDRAVVRVVAAIRGTRPTRERARVIAFPSSIVVFPSRLLAGAAGLRGPPRS
jgi:hypothetical protein